MPRVTTCPQSLVLEQLMLGMLPAGQAEPIEEHVTHCSRCADTLGKLRTRDPLVDAVRGVREKSASGDPEAARAMIPWLKRMRPKETTQTLPSRGEDATLPPAEPARPVVGEDATLPPGTFPHGGEDVTPGFTAPGGSAKQHVDEPTEQITFDFLSPPQEPGEMGRLGPYRVLRPLGAGGMGMVFLAEDPLLKRRIALKVIKPEMVERDDIRERFIAEAQAVAKVEHENIVAIYEVGEQRGVPYLAMPLLRGESLEDRLKGNPGPLPLADVLLHGREIAAGAGRRPRPRPGSSRHQAGQYLAGEERRRASGGVSPLIRSSGS